MADTDKRKLVGQYTATKDVYEDVAGPEDFDPLADRQKAKTIYGRQSEYHKRKFDRAFQDLDSKTDAEIEELRELEREEQRVLEEIERRKRLNGDDDNKTVDDGSRTPPMDRSATPPLGGTPPMKDASQAPKKKSRWDIPPEKTEEEPKRKRSRWDQAPAEEKNESQLSTKESTASRNFLITDSMLGKLLPVDGYEILEPPPDYKPIRIKAHKATSAQEDQPTGYTILEDTSHLARQAAPDLPSQITGVGELAYFKESDMKYFGKLVQEPDEKGLSSEEVKERKVLRLLLRVKNGVPAVRKAALHTLTTEARTFGPQALFNQILPLLMEKTLEDQECYLLVKVIDRVLYKLGDLIRPFTHRILVVIEPLLIDDDFYARVTGREIISNLSKAAGLPSMIATLRPDIDHADEYVRNTTARTFAVVASALGIPKLLPFLNAVCHSKKSWQARHTGVKVVQQIAILMGCGVLPHLRGLVECVGKNLTDDQNKVRTMAAQALAALAEASAPYGIESFEDVLEPLWLGVRRHRGKTLANFLKCIGYIIPLMDVEYANYYTREVMSILLREFTTPDEDMKKVVLKVVQQCSATEGVTTQYLRETVMPPFFKSFWVRRLALDRKNYKLVVETTVVLSRKVGVAEIVENLVPAMKDESEPFRRMAVDTVDKIMTSMGATDVSDRLEERLIDAILLAFQEQSTEDSVILQGFATIVNSLGHRVKPYIPQIVSTILFRLNNQSPTVRQQAADLISGIALAMKKCGEDVLMGKLGNILYEQLGEEYPEVLGSILGALRSIVAVVGLSNMQPPIRDLLPRLTPILRNRHEKVQGNAIDLVGRIADRGAEYVSAREWMRICFELLDMLKAHKKGIRRAANNTFGYIAKAIGPQDVLAALLSILRVQERQSRVCTAVAIGIVAETCAPFAVLPAVMNEYRVPDLNVQNGVLKSLTFMFEYIGDMAKDYIYTILPLIEDALTDRDAVHRQTGATVVRHLALNCMGLGLEDAMVHFLNLLLPNIYETSPHVIDRILDAIDCTRNAVGMGVAMNYIWAGLFHAARKVRTPYWRLYNMAYVQNADSMVPYYPELAGNDHRDELDVWI